MTANGLFLKIGIRDCTIAYYTCRNRTLCLLPIKAEALWACTSSDNILISGFGHRIFFGTPFDI